MPELDENLITMAEAAVILGVSIRTAERMQADGMLVPIYVPRGRRLLRRFNRTKIEAQARAERISA